MIGMSRRGMLALSLVWMVTGGAAMAQSLSGDYRAEGRNPDGSAYEGDVKILEQGDVVSVAWQVGAQGYTGSGRRDGRVVTVNWGARDPVVYVVMPNGQLNGTWADGTALERLIRK